MKIIIPGGTGHVGQVLAAAVRAKGHEVVILSRRAMPEQNIIQWDGRTLGAWAEQLDGADAVINLAGRSVNCRYTAANKREMMAALRTACGTRIGLPATQWMLEIGAFLLRTESELVLKSRRVIPARLRAQGFAFDFGEWPRAAEDLVQRWRAPRGSAQRGGTR